MTTTDLRLGAIGQIARPTKDIERAVAWYRDVLGLPHLIHRHDSGVEEWMALFTDVDGQLLALIAQVTP